MPQYKKGETAYIASIPATAAGKAPFRPPVRQKGGPPVLGRPPAYIPPHGSIHGNVLVDVLRAHQSVEEHEENTYDNHPIALNEAYGIGSPTLNEGKHAATANPC